MSSTDLPRQGAYGAVARQPAPAQTVLVWDWPLRLWHWALAACLLVAFVTPNLFDGAHRAAGYTVLALLAFRLLWGFLGPRHARFRTLPARLRAAPRYLVNLWRGRPGRYLGLNPAGALMLVALLLLLAVSGVTGAMQVTLTFFGVWWVQDTHTVVSWTILGLIVVHVVGVILTSIAQRENLPRAMVTGRKQRRPD